MSERNLFDVMEITTSERGRPGLLTLRCFAPPNLHDSLMNLLPRLATLGGEFTSTPRLGTDGRYEWLLMARTSAELNLLVARADGKRMTIAEGVAIEREARRRARAWPGITKRVRIRPNDFVDSAIEVQVATNIHHGRRWSHGLV